MGWLREDAPGHEGYLVGLVRDGHHRWRELGTDADRELADTAPERRITVERVQVGCDCGWRSPILHAPLGAHWWPSIVDFDRNDEEWRDAAESIWNEHIEDVRRHGEDLVSLLLRRRREKHPTARAAVRS